MDADTAIEIRDMSKSFKTLKDKPKTLKDWIIRPSFEGSRHEVLKNISLDIQKGETVALIGTNGSGKSTLLKIMTRILYPNSGTVKTNGKVTSLLELGAGFHPDFTGRENIYFNASVFGMTREEIDKRVDDIIAFSELGPFIDEPVRTYSSGMYMRLAFSVAINVDADILLIDEILAVGDQHFQNKCFAKLQELRDSDTTIVIVSHSLDSVKDLCSRAVWIYKGALRLDGDPAYVIQKYLKQSALDNREEMENNTHKESIFRKGILFIDRPKGFVTLPARSCLEMSGWSVSNAAGAVVEVKLDGQPVEGLTHTPRPDVYEVYEEEYAGLMDPDTIGWSITVCLDEKQGVEHVIDVLLKSNEQIIDQKRVRVKVEA